MASRSRKNQARGKRHSRQTHTLDVFLQSNKLVEKQKQKKKKKPFGLLDFTVKLNWGILCLQAK